MPRFAASRLVPHRAQLSLICAASAMLLGACATGSGGAGATAGQPTPKPVEVASSAKAIVPTTTLRCGKDDIVVRANAEQAEVTVGSKRYLLQPQRSASGARYASSAYPGTSFWSKGPSGMLVVEGLAYPECTTVTSATSAAAPAQGGPPRDLTVREWVVESIDGRGVVDNSRSTLTFDPRGQIAGRAGCNRYSGTYHLQGARFEVKGVATTRMICVPALMDQETRFLKALDAASAWRLQPDGSLLLTGPDGHKVLAR